MSESTQTTDCRRGRRPAPTEPGYVSVAEAAEEYRLSTRALQQRIARFARAGYPVRRQYGWVHRDDLVAALDAYKRGEIRMTDKPCGEARPRPRYDARVEVAALARCLAADTEPVLAEIAVQIAEAATPEEQQQAIAALAASPDLAHQCAAESLAELATGRRRCILKPYIAKRGKHGCKRAEKTRPDAYAASSDPRNHALRQLRDDLGLTQREASKRFGLPPGKWKGLEQQRNYGYKSAAIIDRILAEAGVEITPPERGAAHAAHQTGHVPDNKEPGE
jgi:hypothetical protein